MSEELSNKVWENLQPKHMHPQQCTREVSLRREAIQDGALNEEGANTQVSLEEHRMLRIIKLKEKVAMA